MTRLISLGFCKSLTKLISCTTCIIFFFYFYFYFICIFISGGLNLSLAQVQQQSPDNRTFQTVVKAYLEEFVGRYTQEKMG